MYYRYIATDRYGSYSLLSPEPLVAPRDGSVELRLVDATENYTAACRAHQAVEARLRGERYPERHPRASKPRGPAA